MRRTYSYLASSLATLGLLAGLPASSRMQEIFAPLPAEVAAPADNPTTPERVALGRLLFWDPLLSGQKDVSCATCHHPDAGYAENRDLSIGANGQGLGATRTFASGSLARHVKRNSQTVLNAAFNGISTASAYDPAAAPMFWDLRVKSLEAQALEPLKAAEEMRGEAYPEHQALSTVVSRLNAVPEYQQRFARAFGTTNAVTVENVGKALAAFERTLVASNAPFDRYMRGDTTAMSAEAVRGMSRFQNIGCANCHNGPMFSDFKSHVLGIADNSKLEQSDAGSNGQYGFRTASLRNLASTAPYMHNGTLASLNDVVDFYRRASRGGGRGNRGGGGRGAVGPTDNPNVARNQVDPLVRQLNMRGGRERDLLAFLDALNDPTFDRTIPENVPSGLPVGGKIQ
jgi:cytochrome c peroxidase